MEVLRDLRPRRHVTVRDPLRRAAFALLLAVGASMSVAACAGLQQAGPLRPADAGPKWPVKTREHVDLWLHAFAMLQEDTAAIPLFSRGYRDRLIVARNARNVSTDLDRSGPALARVLTDKPAMLNVQFLALYFGSWEELNAAFGYLQRTEGDPRRANDAQVQGVVAFLAQQFPTAADRAFAQQLLAAVASEREQFHHAWWVEETRTRAQGLARADTLWQSTWRPALQRYLDHTQQGNGDLIPSLALGGEGRAVPTGKQGNQYAVAWPSTADSAAVLLYTFAHEAVGSVAQVAVNDHLTPVQQREGLGVRYGSAGLVRGGLLLVERVAPQLAEGYARFYLRQAGRPLPAANARAALAAAFPMPEEMLGSMRRQIDGAFGGI